MLKIIQVSLLICFSFLLVNAHAEEQKQRVIVLTDMGADPDDRQSLVRLLVYANKIDIEGLIPTTSVWRQNPLRDTFGPTPKTHGHPMSCSPLAVRSLKWTNNIQAIV